MVWSDCKGENCHCKNDEIEPKTIYNSSREEMNEVINQVVGQDEIVNHPKHYVSHPSGVECIQVTEHFNFNLGNAIKYIWRSDLKGKQVEDLKKAIWYIERELKRIEK